MGFVGDLFGGGGAPQPGPGPLGNPFGGPGGGMGPGGGVSPGGFPGTPGTPGGDGEGLSTWEKILAGVIAVAPSAIAAFGGQNPLDPAQITTDPLPESLRPLRDMLAEEAINRFQNPPGQGQPFSQAPGAFEQLFGPGGFAQQTGGGGAPAPMPQGPAPGLANFQPPPGTGDITRQSADILKRFGGMNTAASNSGRAQTPGGISERRR